MTELPCDKYRLRQIERCCGTCKHFLRIWEDASCEHPEHMHNVFVDEGFICDLWEKRGCEVKGCDILEKKGGEE